MTPVPAASLQFPFAEPPAPGMLIKVADGIQWLRLALPFRLNHVNVYLLDDGPGVVLIDTGIGNAETQAVWEALLGGVLQGRTVTRIIATHCHPDHVGMAGWLCTRTGAPLLMSQTEYLTSLNIHLDPAALDAEPYRSFYLGHGLDPDITAGMLKIGHRYLRMVTGLPRVFRRVIEGEVLRIGRRDWAVLSGGGHSPEQLMLHCAADGLFIAADQVLARITPNISVQANDPEGDPLGIFLRSLERLRGAVPADVTVLPGHNLPFVGLHTRLDELAAHHAARCDAIVTASQTPHSVAELVPVVFGRTIDDPHQMAFAFSEALAHVNYLRRSGRVRLAGGKVAA